MRKFIKYSIYGLLSGLIFALFIGLSNNPIYKTIRESLTSALIIFIPCGFLISTLLYWYIEFYLPKKRNNFLSRQTYLQFQKIGFHKKEGLIEGNYKGFHFNIFWLPISAKHGKIKSGFSSIIIEIHCKINNDKINSLKNKYKKEILIWQTDRIANNIEIYFLKPKIEKILLKMNNMIEILNENRIKSDI